MTTLNDPVSAIDKHYYYKVETTFNHWSINEISYHGQPLEIVSIDAYFNAIVIIYDEYYEAFCKGIKLILDFELKREQARGIDEQ
jgi:hypothetical protein